MARCHELLRGAIDLRTFHHDPGQDDDTLTRLLEKAGGGATFPFQIVPGTEGLSVELGDPGASSAVAR
jgi:hypothetical protein